MEAKLDDKRKPINTNRSRFIGGSDARFISGNDEAAPLRLWQDIRAKVEKRDLALGVATKHSNLCSYEAVRGRVSIGWRVAAVCYATAVILLVSWPWSFLLVLLPFPIGNKHQRFYAFRTVAAKESMRWRGSYRRGSST